MHEDSDNSPRLLGIVIPTARCTDYLVELLDSLLSQSDSGWEAVIVDDSGNGSVRRDLGVRRPKAKVSWLENSTNLGLPQSWNVGLKIMQSRHRYFAIAVVHDDDLLHSDYVRETQNLMTNHPDIAVLHYRTRVIDGRGKRKLSVQDAVKSLFSPYLWNRSYVSEGDRGLARILRNNFVFCPSMVFNTELLPEIEFDVHWRFVSDLDFVSRSLLSHHRFLRSPKPMYIYRRHRQNATSKFTDSTERFAEEISLYKTLEKKCLESAFFESAAAARRRSSIRCHILYRMVLSLFRADKEKLRRLRRHWRDCVTR